MSEKKVIETLAECIDSNTPVVLATVVYKRGSSPGKPGAMMLVHQDRSTVGAVGGGALEFKVIEEAVTCLREGIDKEISFDLKMSSELQMSCGGEVRIFLKSFSRQSELVIAGAGHIGLDLYRLAVNLGFRVVIIDDRENLNSSERFPDAKRIVTDSVVRTLKEYAFSTDSYIAIATASHDTDRLALEAVLGSASRYKGMIGSRNKVNTCLNYLKEKGATDEQLKDVYAPMGLDIATVKVSEIALSIMSEIMLVKNCGSLAHLKDCK